ncbi:MAG: cell envelope integrity protein TolA [Oleiphilus sp.]
MSDSEKLHGRDRLFAEIESKALPQKKLLVASFILHLFFFSLLFLNWESREPIKKLHMPNNIQAHVVKLDDLQHFKDKKEAEKQALQRQKEREKQAIEKQRKLKQEKERALEKKKQEARQKAAEDKKREDAKKLQLKKKKEEEAKKELEKKQQLAEEQKKIKREQEKAEKLKAEKLLAEKQQQAIKAQEDKLFEKLQAAEKQRSLELAQKKAQAEEQQRQARQAFLEYELSETERFTVLIRSKIENLWRIPPKSQGLKVSLRIRLFPNGELDSVAVTNSSGNAAFDRSAELAVKSVRRFPTPEDSQVFENNFRQFTMSFSPILP